MQALQFPLSFLVQEFNQLVSGDSEEGGGGVDVDDLRRRLMGKKTKMRVQAHSADPQDLIKWADVCKEINADSLSASDEEDIKTVQLSLALNAACTGTPRLADACNWYTKYGGGYRPDSSAVDLFWKSCMQNSAPFTFAAWRHYRSMSRGK
eukprot:356350-Pelagomonas_calceolata.AAC.2